MNKTASDVGRPWPDTHGRWPWLAAAAALPSSLALWMQRDRLAEGDAWAFWVAGPVLLWHQTEEWVSPGGFLPWFNPSVMGGSDEFPITRRAGLAINVGLGWGLSLAAAVTGRRAAALTTLNLGLVAGNVAVHVGAALKQHRYNPGLATAIGLFIPVVALAAPRLARDPRVGRGVTAGGIAAGLVVSGGVLVGVRRRAHGDRGQLTRGVHRVEAGPMRRRRTVDAPSGGCGRFRRVGTGARVGGSGTWAARRRC